MNRFVALLALTLLPTAFAAQPQRRPSDMERGKELYERHCASCHGFKNRGDGPATEALVAPVPDLVGKVQADDATTQIVMMGKGPMPSFEASFDAKDARRVLKYMIEAHIKGDEKKNDERPAEDDAEPPPADEAPADDAQGG